MTAFNAYALLLDQRTSGTNGGTATINAWTTRALQTESADPDGIVSITTNEFTLQAGTYYILGRSQHLDCDVAKVKIRNITDSTDAIIGETGYNNAGEWTGGIWLEAKGRITIASAKAFALQYFVSATVGVGDLGSAASQGVEIYASVEIWRESTDLKISQLGAVTILNNTDELVLARTGTSKKITRANLKVDLERDPIFDVFGTPDTVFEFSTSSLTGLTALTPVPDVVNADTTVPGHYYLKDDTTAFAVVGHYATCPAAPFTAITKLSGHKFAFVNSAGGLFVGVATPGAMDAITVGNGNILCRRYTSPTVYGSNVGSTLTVAAAAPLFLAIRATSSTSFDFYFSWDGRIWFTVVGARDPALTIASVGLHLFAQVDPVAAAFDYLRIWNSSKTFPGV